MAPLQTGQNHSLAPSPRDYGKESPAKPVPVETSIDPRVFGELLTGTVGIFVFAVLFWKLGKFIRSLNRHKVLQEGKLTTTRYARTWYGWVSVETHERNKSLLRTLFKHIREWVSWESTETDYQWVWWDPGLEAMEERRVNRRRLKLLPECLKSYEAMPDIQVPYPRSSIECRGALIVSQESASSRPIGSATRGAENLRPLPRIHFNKHHFGGSTASSASQQMFTPPSRTRSRSSEDQTEGSQRLDGRICKHVLTLPTQIQSLQISTNSQSFLRNGASWADRHTDRMRRPSHPRSIRNSFHVAEPSSCSNVYQSLRRARETPRPALRGVHSRKYRLWSAQMQMKSTGLAQQDLRESSGPPGTPATALLASLLSEQSSCEIAPETRKKSLIGATTTLEKISVIPDQPFQGKQAACAIPLDTDMKYAKFNTAPARFRPLKKSGVLNTLSSNQLWHSWRDTRAAGRPRNSFQELWTHPGTIKARTKYAPLPSCLDGVFEAEQISFDKLSDWEVRLIDRLDRKLLWIFNEMTPGLKPYHFTLLANHWLNRETWLVIDPPSRVPIHNRRQWGDPRFNDPYPEADRKSRPKYPAMARKRAQVPRIVSWRAAVNRQRRISGIRDAIRTIELYEDSAEEPPDGKIDPACWILPKPPQGFEMSTQQKNAWYEGGTGWQEKLEDWQQVRRGYRLRKIVHEGRVNRNRVKEVAFQVNRCCRTASLKLLPRGIAHTAPQPQPVV
ncbi:uncharacterized protein N7482_003999 [Penicillium canariense]|uniref:Uncharacterized protein n=1 Tax=Penicillium canariense TaxID=189055 RepID=A0A9W9I5T4_9EURO|nr:uncharacterized protein N7482_003999 [Penicillium canariense]KAJ5168405.1 hypothetical protein N7482_003999 [Penicillium canariense]